MKKFIYRIIKILRTKPKNKNLKSNLPQKGVLGICGYNLNIGSENPLIQIYKDYPTYGKELGRLAKVIDKHYPTSTALDIGANIGDTCAIIMQSSKMKVVCFEGDPKVCDFLIENSNQLKGIQIFNIFLGEYSENLKINYEKKGWNTTILPNKAGEELVELHTLNKVWKEELNSENIKLIKIDTEGFDFKIIRGATELIQSLKPVIYCEYNRENLDVLGENPLDTFKILADIGYTDIVYFDNYGKFILSDSLKNEKLLNDLHDYIRNGSFSYFDVCIFHEIDKQLFYDFVLTEKQNIFN